ncbi:Aromatic ring-opening dioxygenase, catalytic subunit, LigB family [Raineyella antarctica]|uniref:Aromatic ring-opening dioxygenase, catalytic subunit, LigB family n=1 Tax=Raineyella antarctica TaxID=1577474 RepID=A0A1G6H8I4_9ACTN|nr:class III extradiol ring-cleavage dioxygenase [Raineyella antarctica]SDB90580.1 Aromatic ring-opening dioxygenase, catalytic subunit, LigB family [Raineyella antarctica]
MTAPNQPDRLPTYFVSHGGGPWPWIKDLMPGDMGKLEKSLQDIPRELGVTPRAILAVSGHWEESEFTVQTNPHPPMLYDYGGFPDFTYRIQYPAPGAPDVAARVGQLLDEAGIPTRYDAQRGYDHGVFAPFFVMYPDADVPILQLSLRSGYDPAAHLAAGRALAPLRDEGVLIVGSGFSYHNLRNFGPRAAHDSKAFGDWLTEAVVEVSPQERTQRLLRWDTAPSARAAHPAEDHLVPLMVAVGAAEDEAGVRIYHEPDFMGSVDSSSYRFGALPGRAGARA